MPPNSRTASDVIDFPPFQVDLRAGLLRRDGNELNLRPKTFAVLLHLAAHPGELVTKQALLEAVWPGLAVTEDVVRISVGELRAAFGDGRATPRFIETAPRRGYRFIAQLGAPASVHHDSSDSMIDAVPEARGTVVGRVRERKKIADWLRAARDGRRQVVFVSGDAGIGKTTLVDTALHELAAGFRVARGQCIEHFGGGEPHLPVVDALAGLCRGADGEAVRATLGAHAPEWVMRLLGRSPSEPEPASASTHEHMLHKLASAIDALAAETPLALVLEDVQWSDYATLDLVSVLAQRREPARLMVLCTLRAADAIVHGHPVAGVKRELLRKGLCSEILLDGLPPEDVATWLAARFAGAELPDELLSLFVARTEGNPFFVATLGDHLLEHELLVRRDERWELRGSLEALRIVVPEGLRAVIEPRLERLERDDRAALEMASVIGPEFPAHAITAIAPRETDLGDVEYVEQLCDGLVRRHGILRAAGETTWPDGSSSARYAFSHALYRQVAYQRIPASMRRRLHQAVGESLETAWAGRTTEVASELASHFERSRDIERAVRYRAEAAANARSRFAYRETRLHLEAALGLMRTQPASPERLEREIALLQELGLTSFAIDGYGSEDGARAFAQMRALAQGLDGGRTLFEAMQGQFVVHTMRAELTLARALGEELIVLAERLDDPLTTANTHVVLAATLYNLGEVEAAHRHAERGWALFDPELPPLPSDVGITCPSILASTSGYLGRVGAAQALSRAAVERGARLGTPFHRAFATNLAAQLCMLLDDAAGARRLVTEALDLATEYDFSALRVTAVMLRGWCDVEAGDVAAGLASLRAAFREYVATGQRFGTTSFGGILAWSHLAAGDVAGAQQVVEDALAFAAETGERVYEPEFHRLRGECVLADAPPTASATGRRKSAAPAAAIAHFERALAIAAERKGLLFELRAATSLCRVQKSSRERLGGLVDRFGPADDGADLRAARAVLAG